MEDFIDNHSVRCKFRNLGAFTLNARKYKERTCSRDDRISTEGFLVISRQGFLAAAATQ